jgi:hypothetical protein
MLRHRGLGYPETLGHVLHVALLVEESGNYLQPERMTQRLECHRKPFGPGRVYATFHIYIRLSAMGSGFRFHVMTVGGP